MDPFGYGMGTKHHHYDDDRSTTTSTLMIPYGSDGGASKRIGGHGKADAASRVNIGLFTAPGKPTSKAYKGPAAAGLPPLRSGARTHIIKNFF
ncbi:unnamed protein product [Urochloa humidicola]